MHSIVIPTGPIQATDFDKVDAKGVNSLLTQGREASRRFLRDELSHVKAQPNSESVCYGVDERYSAITEALFDNVREVVVAERGTEWVFSLFPTLLAWRMQGCVMRVLLPPLEKDRPEAIYQRRLLRALGIQVHEVEGVPVTAWLMNPEDPYAPRAVVGLPKSGTHTKLDAIRYEGLLNGAAIRALNYQIGALLPSRPTALERIAIAATNQDELVRRLKTLPQYKKAGVHLSVEVVPVSRLVSLTKYVREYKSRQIGRLVELYRENNLELFEPAVVKLINGQESIITPPVVEESDNNLLIVEGSTRAVYCRDYGIERFAAVVVRNVSDPIPSEPVEFNRVRVVSKTLQPQQRYSDFAYSQFRHIENSVHPYDSISE